MPMRSPLKSLPALAVALAMSLASTAAPAANFLELNFWLSGPRYDGNMRQCTQALGTIAANFAEKESKFWNSSLAITGFTEPQEVAYRVWASQSIPRRFCTVSAMLNDGVARQVHYTVTEDGGFAGYDSGVEFCVVGLDRNWAFNPRCKAAGP